MNPSELPHRFAFTFTFAVIISYIDITKHIKISVLGFVKFSVASDNLHCICRWSKTHCGTRRQFDKYTRKNHEEAGRNLVIEGVKLDAVSGAKEIVTKDFSIEKCYAPQLQSILVTGGAGFIGHHLVRRLLQNHRVVIIDNLSSGKNIPKDENIAFYKEDIRNKETISDIVKREKIDTCIHLAAKTSVADSIIHPQETTDVNVHGTASVLEACAKSGVQDVIFASSAAVYGEPKVLPIPEDHLLKPLSPYGASKASSEELLAGYKNSSRIKGNAVSLRFFNIYGEGQNPEYAGVITKFAERLSNGLPPIIYGNGEQTRDFVSVNDVTNAIILAATKAEDTSGAFNIGTGRPTSINELAKKMIKAFNLDVEPRYEQARKGDIVDSYANITKSKRILGFVPAETLDSSLKRPLKWLLKT